MYQMKRRDFCGCNWINEEGCRNCRSKLMLLRMNGRRYAAHERPVCYATIVGTVGTAGRIVETHSPVADTPTRWDL